ncbi:MAG: T9SS type A sorting domain-containing protein [Ignavibacteriae bacterium]|nr:T9SS type A sorting domain-containing protein [Ignavibacteriota bacterium]
MCTKYTIYVSTITILLLSSIICLSAQSTDSTIFFDDFEHGSSNWTVDNGLWQIGSSTIVTAYNGTNIAGTLLNENIPNQTYTTRLITKPINLPSISSQDELRLRYYSWFSRANNVNASIQMAIDTGGGNFGPWTGITLNYTTAYSPWTHSSVELTKFAGKRVKIGFTFIATYDRYDPAGGPGWYVDDISIVRTQRSAIFPSAWDFEVDSTLPSTYHNKWTCSNFLWQIGSSTLVPAYSDTNIAGTILNGNIPNDTYTARLITPAIQLPIINIGEEIRFRFKYSLYLQNNVNATVHIRTDSGGGRWGNFESTPLAGPYTVNTSWTTVQIPVPAKYSNKRVQFSFAINATYDRYDPAGGYGFYIDGVDIFHPDSLPQAPKIFSYKKDSVGLSFKPTLRWHLAAGADEYQVQIDTNADFSTIIRDTTLTKTSWKLQQALPVRYNYYYRVRAMNGNGRSPWYSSYCISPNILVRFNTLLFWDAYGGGQSLFYGPKDSTIDPRKYELPPLPPECIFDARFTSNKMLELADTMRDTQFTIAFRSCNYPITIQWDATNLPTLNDSLIIESNSFALNGKGAVRIENPDISQCKLRIGRFIPNSVEDNSRSQLPTQFTLDQNYPNPFNPVTVIRYQLPVQSYVTLGVYDILGKQVASLVNREQTAGSHEVPFDASALPSGIYMYRIQAGTFSDMKKLVLMR